jgi:hypothetical protein
VGSACGGKARRKELNAVVEVTHATRGAPELFEGMIVTIGLVE